MTTPRKGPLDRMALWLEAVVPPEFDEPRETELSQILHSPIAPKYAEVETWGDEL